MAIKPDNNARGVGTPRDQEHGIPATTTVPAHQSAGTGGTPAASPANATAPRTRSNRGFASMDSTKQREIASKGGRAAHLRGTAHEFDAGEARAAGRKGGVTVSQNRDHMAAIGKRGGEARGANRLARQQAKVAAAPQHLLGNGGERAPADREVGMNGSLGQPVNAAPPRRANGMSPSGEHRGVSMNEASADRL